MSGGTLHLRACFAPTIYGIFAGRQCADPSASLTGHFPQRTPRAPLAAAIRDRGRVLHPRPNLALSTGRLLGNLG